MVGSARLAPPPRVVGASSTGALPGGTILPFMASSRKGVSVATF